MATPSRSLLPSGFHCLVVALAESDEVVQVERKIAVGLDLRDVVNLEPAGAVAVGVNAAAIACSSLVTDAPPPGGVHHFLVRLGSLATAVSGPLGRTVTFRVGAADRLRVWDEAAALRADNSDRTHSIFPRRETKSSQRQSVWAMSRPRRPVSCRDASTENALSAGRFHIGAPRFELGTSSPPD